ncbi:MAG: BrnA antitoxin family protein [Bacteroidetes bacterium]|nr:BrnA antitoxin family protein [Bacteroidota bacterium]
MSKKKFKQIPKFKNEDEEREFWATHDTTDYVDWKNDGKIVEFPNLKMSTETISLRMTKSLLDRIKAEANKRDMPYQSLIKYYLQERIDKELRKN